MSDSTRLRTDGMVEEERPEIKLADALDKFFYDLVFTAPECWAERVNELGARIQPTMEALGYPKQGQKKDVSCSPSRERGGVMIGDKRGGWTKPTAPPAPASTRLASMPELQTTPDSSKDLEKDEREAMLSACHDTSLQDRAVQAGWHAAKAHFEARLQQVEAERDVAIHELVEAERDVAIHELVEAERDVAIHELVEAERDVAIHELGLPTRAEAELSIAREALGEINETYDQYGMGSPEASILRSIAVNVLARLQAKEEGT